MTLTYAQGVVATTGLTGEGGGYSFTALKDGQYTLAVSAGGYRPAARQVIISDGEEVRADIQLAELRAPVRPGAHQDRLLDLPPRAKRSSVLRTKQSPDLEPPYGIEP
jgi:Carboxypeptidase regulatory-like domain